MKRLLNSLILMITAVALWLWVQRKPHARLRWVVAGVLLLLSWGGLVLLWDLLVGQVLALRQALLALDRPDAWFSQVWPLWVEGTLLFPHPRRADPALLAQAAGTASACAGTHPARAARATDTAAAQAGETPGHVAQPSRQSQPASRLALGTFLNQHQRELERQGVDDRTLRTTIKEEQRVADAEIATYEQRQWRAYDQSNAEYDKCERYCRKQRELLRQVADLEEGERAMFEVDHAKDQVMTVLKLALVNLVMWTRDRYFPVTNAQATWHRLEPLFRLPGRVVWGPDNVQVALRPFNDRQLTCDLVGLCQQVGAGRPRLPDGRWLGVRLAMVSYPALPA